MGSKNNPGVYDCYAKAELDEPMFVLLGRDTAAPFVVDFWERVRKDLGATEPEVLAEAHECALAMNDWALDRLGKETVTAASAARHVQIENAFRLLVYRGREIWGPEKLDAAGVLVRLTVDSGKLARYVRGATKDSKPCERCDGRGFNEFSGICKHCRGTKRVPTADLRLIMGNILFSVIRWCDDLGVDPAEACELAAEQQRRFAAENPER